MKKNLLIIILLTFIFISCNTSPKIPEPVFEPSLKSPSIPVGEAELQINRAFPMPGIRKIPVTVSYFPVEDAVCLRWRANNFTYHYFFSPICREVYRDSLEKYKIDFEERNFGRNSKSARRKYGKSNGYIYWQMASFMVLAHASTTVDYGYTFVDKAPYYTLTQRQAEFIDPNIRDNNRTLQQYPLYFTRAQADQLNEFLNEEFLATLFLTVPATVREIEVDIDEYDD